MGGTLHVRLIPRARTTHSFRLAHDITRALYGMDSSGGRMWHGAGPRVHHGQSPRSSNVRECPEAGERQAEFRETCFF